MSAITYRDATAADGEALAACARDTWVATFGHLYPPEDLNAYVTAKYGADIQRREIADPYTRYRIGARGGEIVGFCMMGALDLPVADRDGAVELHRLYVEERVKGAGVAAALIEDCIAWARTKGARAMYLSVWENNHRAQRFYRRYGFEDHGEWDFMVGRVADRDLIWRLTL